MVAITLIARSPAGEQAIRKYHDEKLGFLVRAQMRRRQISGERRIVCEAPLTHVSVIGVQGADAASIRKRFQAIKDELEILYEKKMLNYGASKEDYYMKVDYE